MSVQAEVIARQFGSQNVLQEGRHNVCAELRYWTEMVIGNYSRVTGPVSFLVKLQDGRLIRRHQDHLRRRVLDEGPEKTVSDDIPEILVDAGISVPNPPENDQPEDSTDASVAGSANSNMSATTGDHATPQTPSATCNSEVSKTYPQRQRKPPDRFL